MNNAIHLNNGSLLSAKMRPNTSAVVAFPSNAHQTYMISLYPSPSYPIHMRERASGDLLLATTIDGLIPQGTALTWGRRREVESLAFLNPGEETFTIYIQPITTFL